MSFQDRKITTAAINGHKVVDRPDTLYNQAETAKSWFDDIPVNFIIPAFNTAMDDLYGYGIDYYRTGWIPISETFVFVSTDNPTGVIKVTGKNVTANFKAGMRLKFDNGGNTIYGIVSKDAELSGSDTLITYLHEINPGTNQAKTLIANSAITNPYYSVQKAPLGFPIEPEKWTLIATNTSQIYQTTPTNGTFYNIGAVKLDIHTGAWDVDYALTLQALVSAAGYASVACSLSTSANSESDNDFRAQFTAYGNAAGTSGQTAPVYRRKQVVLASKTPYYLIARANDGNCGYLEFRGDFAKTIIRAVCAYL